MPAGIVDEETKQLYVLLPSHEAGKFPEKLVTLAGHRVTIEGDLLEADGTPFLTVKSFR